MKGADFHVFTCADLTGLLLRMPNDQATLLHHLSPNLEKDSATIPKSYLAHNTDIVELYSTSVLLEAVHDVRKRLSGEPQGRVHMNLKRGSYEPSKRGFI